MGGGGGDGAGVQIPELTFFADITEHYFFDCAKYVTNTQDVPHASKAYFFLPFPKDFFTTRSVSCSYMCVIN